MIRLVQFFIIALCVTVCCQKASAQERLALKSGESVDLSPVYWVVQCRSIMIGLPTVEILEGPPGVFLSIREGMVLPRRQNCATPVPGGTLVISAKDIAEPADAKLAYRLKYKTKDGERVRGNVYRLSLYP